jgi:hypothetical protein
VQASAIESKQTSSFVHNREVEQPEFIPWVATAQTPANPVPFTHSQINGWATVPLQPAPVKVTQGAAHAAPNVPEISPKF